MHAEKGVICILLRDLNGSWLSVVRLASRALFTKNSWEAEGALAGMHGFSWYLGVAERH